jgi:hypothetical protein
MGKQKNENGNTWLKTLDILHFTEEFASQSGYWALNRTDAQ